jgi:hypothetical protein
MGIDMTREEMNIQAMALLFHGGYLFGHHKALEQLTKCLEDERKRALLPLGYLKFLDGMLTDWKINSAIFEAELDEFDTEFAAEFAKQAGESQGASAG